MEAAIDIAAPRVGVDVVISAGSDKMWVNVDGVCVLRIQRIEPGMLKMEADE